MSRLANINLNLLQDNGDYDDHIKSATGLDNKKSFTEGVIKTTANKNLDLEAKTSAQTRFSGKEVGLKSPTSEAYVRLRENGETEVVAGTRTGIYLNPLKKHINIFSDTINLKAATINHECEPMGFRINGYALNPMFYNMCNNELSQMNISDFSIYGHGRVWNSGLQGLHGAGYVKAPIEIKPFFPLASDTTQKELDELNGWKFERGGDDAY